MRLDIVAGRDYINAHPERLLQQDRSGKGFICPLCGNGSGEDGTGLRLNPRDKTRSHYKCFRCGFYGDIVELIAQKDGIKDNAKAFDRAREIYGIEILYRDVNEVNMSNGNDTNDKNTAAAEALSDLESKQASIKGYITGCRANISEAADYLKGRGISLKTAIENGLGFDVDKKAVVIPNIGKDKEVGYTLRYTNPEGNIRYTNAEGVGVGLFVGKGIDLTGVLFVTEGAFDALSLREVGAENVVALNSGNNSNKLINMLRIRREGKELLPDKVILVMDNDEAGKGYTEALSEALQGLKVKFDVMDIGEGVKDPNELLTANPEALRAAVYRVLNPQPSLEVSAHKIGALLPEFKSYIKDPTNNRYIPTGFNFLDKAMGGGLFPKLYVMGAVSSLGKTTFALQIADSVAQAGNDVLIFSLEMSKEDIIARSISHQTAIIAESKGNMRLAKTELGIETLERYKGYDQEDLDTIREAYEVYAAFASDHISIYTGRYTAMGIREAVEQYIAVTGKKPLVIVDYLQIVQPKDDLKRGTIREQIDDSLYTFTAIRRDYKIPVIVISSFNRNSYNTVADSSSFKESGGIEYNADCVITLELDIEFTKDEEKREGVKREKVRAAMRQQKRDIKLTLHKNRGNRVGSQIYYQYNTPYNYFVEDPKKNIGML